MIDQQIEIPTKDGHTTTFISHLERGTHLATDQPDSPHLAGQKTKAELYFGCAETDVYAPQEIIDKVAAGMKGSNNEVEIYPGTHHGFAFPKRPVYHRDAAERHWERLLALYRRNLVP